jgi:hypothetical protein
LFLLMLYTCLCESNYGGGIPLGLASFKYLVFVRMSRLLF